MLWQEGVSRAGAQGSLALVSRSAQAETGLSFAGLTDLLDPVADEVLVGLPSPQKDALLTALLRGPAPVGGVDERAVSAAGRAENVSSFPESRNRARPGRT
jgi:hypothetical protein